MKEINNGKKDGWKIFLVLVPHRDIRLLLRNYCGSLFKSGFEKAYHFPQAAPLAALSRGLNSEELKKISQSLREANGNEKFNANEASFSRFAAGGKDAFLFGPRLDGNFWKEIIGCTEKVTDFFSPPVIGCLLHDGKNESVPPPPPVSFRAAAVANMHWQAKDEGGAFSVKWKIGRLFWLAKKN